MNSIAIVRALIAGWWIVIGAAAAGTGIAFGITSTTTPVYAATTSYFVSVAGQDTASAADIAQGSSAAQQKIKSYQLLATSPRVLQPVIASLGLDTTPGALAGEVSSVINTGTVVISIQVTDGDPQRAGKLAEAIGKQLSRTVSEIEPKTADGMASVRLEEVTPAQTPTSPISPKKVSDLAIGLATGIAVGAGLALLRAALDTRIRSGEDLDAGVPVVGDIGFDPDADKRPLIVRDDAASPRSEAFRSLRTNIQFLRTGGSRTIAITSARPSEGKTTTAANLAIAMSTSGLRTVIVDADLRRPNLAKTMGIEGAVGLTDLLVGRAELDDVTQRWGRDQLSVIPAGTIPPNPSELIGSEAMEQVFAELTARFDVVLVDTPPVLAVTDSALVSTLVSTTLLVTAANQTKRSDVRVAVEALERVGQRPDGIVLTKTKHKGSRYAYYRSEYAATTAAAD